MFDCYGEFPGIFFEDLLNIECLQKVDGVGVWGAAGDTRPKTPNPWSDIKIYGGGVLHSQSHSFKRPHLLLPVSWSVEVPIAALEVSFTPVLRMLQSTPLWRRRQLPAKRIMTKQMNPTRARLG
jgi:hypothetical protein